MIVTSNNADNDNNDDNDNIDDNNNIDIGVSSFAFYFI